MRKVSKPYANSFQKGLEYNMAGSTKFYRRWHSLGSVVFKIFFRMEIIGQENINEGAAMVCANHSSGLDPIFVGMVLDKNDQPLFIAKAELFKVPGLSWLIKRLGAVPVDRDKADVGIVKATLSSLKQGQKVIIFPEGTRVAEDSLDDLQAKHGAIKIAERANAPILPVYLPRKKSLFRKVRIVIGKPYKIEKADEKRTSADYDLLSYEMMKKIFDLKDSMT